MGDLSSLINFDFHVNSVQNFSDEKIRDQSIALFQFHYTSF